MLLCVHALIALAVMVGPWAATAAAQTGGISGTITDAGTSAPLANVQVRIFNSAGGSVGSAWTDASGVYSRTGLTAGTYYALTSNSLGYIDELYNNLPCPGSSCTVTTGAGVSVTAGVTTNGIDFGLAVGGTIAGTVTDSGTGAPLANVSVNVYNTAGSFIGGIATNASGVYAVTGLPTGTHRLRTVNALSHGYVDELYSDIPCPNGTCPSLATGAEVGVTAGATTSGINFALSLGATIAGTVTDAVSAAPLLNVPVAVHSPSGASVRLGMTNNTGQYAVAGLATGTYYVRTVTTQNYANEIYADIPCPACSATTSSSITVPTAATGVVATEGLTTPGIDFALAPGGTITGTVTAAGSGTPVSGVSVYLYDAGGASLGYVVTNGSGVYTKLGLAAGNYFARASSASYTNEFYNNLPVWTSITAATPIAVSAGAQTTADFALDVNTGPNTSGTAVLLPLGTTENLHYTGGSAPDTIWYKFQVPPEDAGKDLKVNVRITSPYPVPPPANWRSDLDFELLDSAIAVRAIAISGSDNETLYLHNVTPGWYYIYANYFTTTYADSDVSARYSISIETGTAFGVGYISGRAVDGTGNGLAQVQVKVQAVPYNHAVSFPIITTDAEGYFSIAATPEAHDLYFNGDGQTTVNQPEVNVVSEYYSDKATVAAADHVNVVEGSTQSLGNITLDVGAIITGQVTNQSGTPLAMVTVSSYDLAGNSKGYVRTDAAGNYTLMRVPVGGARIEFRKGGYATEYYSDQPSLGSGMTLATQAGVTVPTVNAVLTPGGSISGSVKNGLGDPLAVRLWLYSALDATFSKASYTTSASTGTFSFINVKPGDYKIYVDPLATGLPPVWYGNAASFTDAGTVTVSEGGTASGVNIVLAPRGGGDFTGDRKSDILWRHATGGDLWLWPMDGAASMAQSYIRTVPDTNWEIRGIGDFDGDGKADILWRNKMDGQVYLWPMNGPAPSDEIYVGTVDPAYDIVGTGDFDGDGKSDIIWRHTASGDVWIWLMDGPTPQSEVFIARVDPAYVIRGVGDLTGDHRADIVWHHATLGEVWVWPMNGTTPLSETWVGTVPDTGYRIEGVADFTGDGKADLLWHHATRGEVWIWTMNGAVRVEETWVATVPETDYRIVGTGDYNGDNKADILWHHAVRGEVWVWLMNGTTRVSETWVGTVPETGYQIIR